MFRSHCLRLTRLSLASLILLAGMSQFASAQIYSWKDAQGRVHYGDRPPADEKATRIVNGAKAPPPPATSAPAAAASQPAAAPRAPAAAQSGASASPSSTQSGPKSWQDQDKDYQKRKDDEAKKKVEEAKAAEKQKYCNELRNSTAALNGNTPISKANAKGELTQMSEEERKRDADQLKQNLARDCK